MYSLRTRTWTRRSFQTRNLNTRIPCILASACTRWPLVALSALRLSPVAPPGPRRRHLSRNTSTPALTSKHSSGRRSSRRCERISTSRGCGAASASSWCLSPLRADFASLQKCSRHSRPSTANMILRPSRVNLSFQRSYPPSPSPGRRAAEEFSPQSRMYRVRGKKYEADGMSKVSVLWHRDLGQQHFHILNMLLCWSALC
ncbi:hypothetical protein K438DRAFT_863597 [Mycena galopus ATCC 62051]|nr:hypothetical protein K438DRAFT_863597 [Mycena galopus ATCC 62051]